ncbi:ATP-dependent DNA helicase Rep [Stutzerimonas stutzeri]
MRVSRVRLINFANFSDVDVETGESIVIVGENKVGKSNFIRGLQLILDPGLSERDRQLGLEYFWDGLGEDKVGATIEVSVDLTDFTNDPRLMAHLNDCVINPGPPMVARLTYRFQPKAGLGRAPESLKDYEYIIFGGNDPDMLIGLGRHRRSVLNRNSVAWRSEEELAAWAEAYEAALRDEGLIDYDDMVVFGQRLIAEHDWVLPLVQAKFPVLAVDEYQDLGVALHRIVKRLAFDGGVRLFAVGDADQSIYGFTGADGALLMELAARGDIEPVRLQLNYRSGTGIVTASEMALGEVRGYQASDPARQATIEFVLRPGGMADQAAHVVAQIIPAALASKPGRTLGDIAILYKDYRAGDIVSEAVTAGGLDYIRVDTAAPYRKVSLTSWVEDCAAWCAGGWRVGRPQLRGLIDRYLAFHRASLDDAQARREGQELTALLWALRSDQQPARDFVASLRSGIVDRLLAAELALADQKEQLDRMTAALAEGGALATLDMTSLGGRDGSPDHLNLLTLHSAKGCEYDVVIMVGLDLGNLPWRNESPEKLRESRRLFYVGLTRARDEVHMLYSGFVEGRYGPMRLGRSPFLDELEARMRATGI